MAKAYIKIIVQDNTVLGALAPSVSNSRYAAREKKMPGKAFERTAQPMPGSDRVNVVLSKATYRPDREGGSRQIDYKYYELNENKVQTFEEAMAGCAQIVKHGYPAALLIADINHGLEHRGRDSWLSGKDPSTTDKQRDQIDAVRGLMRDGLMAVDYAEEVLHKAGLTVDQISNALAA